VLPPPRTDHENIHRLLLQVKDLLYTSGWPRLAPNVDIAFRRPTPRTDFLDISDVNPF